jgi:hypothetical protein
VWGESASKEGNLTMGTVNAEIVAIGSELLLGQIVDTNSAWMAQRLARIGVNLFYKTSLAIMPAACVRSSAEP